MGLEGEKLTFHSASPSAPQSTVKRRGPQQVLGNRAAEGRKYLQHALLSAFPNKAPAQLGGLGTLSHPWPPTVLGRKPLEPGRQESRSQ